MAERTFDSELQKLHAWIASEGRGLFNEGLELTLQNCFLSAFETDQFIGAPKSEDNNFLLELADQARALARSIESLTKPGNCHPHLAFKFMGKAWGINRTSEEQSALLDTLAHIEECARQSIARPTNGAPRKTGKRRIVEKAFEFFLAFGTEKPTGNPDGPFSAFSREFYHRATGIDLDNKELRQVREIIKLNSDQIDAKWAGN
ncbi:hypothetical protein [Mesorhizobium sp. B1-1-5]|uniref:hypothetical protein n=1 Tax=Mesorhizobium sp. B1-1-5 TaxID=2589979 RepID=UPI0011280183|nr:hypothetical protein [Mesorhizobium sp. B1-1-5]TPO07136.1 hypothetical protein FJ980_12495 [Mesorhizobium sp. B1-1-5]